MNELEVIDNLLNDATKLLNEASGRIRDVNFYPEINIKRIGYILMRIFEIQHQIYKERPDLKPDCLGDVRGH